MNSAITCAGWAPGSPKPWDPAADLDPARRASIQWTRSPHNGHPPMKDMMKTLVRTGPGTPTGNLLRRYWIPILLSSEIAEPDGHQVRVQILGEKLLAFRDSEGRP